MSNSNIYTKTVLHKMELTFRRNMSLEIIDEENKKMLFPDGRAYNAITAKMYSKGFKDEIIDEVLEVIEEIFEQVEAFNNLLDALYDLLNQLSWNRLMTDKLKMLDDLASVFLKYNILETDFWKLKVLILVLNDWDCDIKTLSQLEFIKNLISNSIKSLERSLNG